MPLADLLRPEQRQWLRRLRRRIANREVMRRHRAANRDKRLCAGVDLPLDAGTCGRLVWPAHERCYACTSRPPVGLNPGGRAMTLIDMLRPEQRQQLRQMRYRIYNREYMRRTREQRKLLCVGVDLPIEAGTCGRLTDRGLRRRLSCGLGDRPAHRTSQPVPQGPSALRGQVPGMGADRAACP